MLRRLALWFVTRFPWLGLTVWSTVETTEEIRDGWVYREVIPGSMRWRITRRG